MNAETHMPPGPRVTVALLRAAGHTVSVRVNRNGSLRYTVNGGPERSALEMTRYYDLLARIAENDAARGRPLTDAEKLTILWKWVDGETP